MKELLVLVTLVQPQQITQAQIDACQADAMKLCSQFISNMDLMHTCMFVHKKELSKPCQKEMGK